MNSIRARIAAFFAANALAALVVLAACAQPEAIVDYDQPYAGKFTPPPQRPDHMVTHLPYCFELAMADPQEHDLVCNDDEPAKPAKPEKPERKKQRNDLGG